MTPSSPAPRTLSRRAVLGGLGLTAAVSGVADLVAPTAAGAATTRDQALHLLRRASYGPTRASLAEAQRLGISGWVDRQLIPSKISDPVVDGLAKRWPRLSLRIWEVREQAEDFGSWDVMNDLLSAHLARAVWSNRQLLESMVGFWTNHLVVPVPSADVWDNAHLFQRDVIRKYALGSYAGMLAAAATHPALLMVLDNADSTKKAPNENFARELLELHTVGVGHYSEADVKNSARALTGLSIDNESGLFEYKPERRWVGKVSVLGWSNANSSPEGGLAVARSYLGYLARHPLTARRIVTKLCVRFVSDYPPAALVTRLAKIYTDHDTAIGPVLRALFTSKEFAASAGQKIKTPLEDAIASVRILGLRPESSGSEMLQAMVWWTGEMGQAPMGWPAPNGYPDVAAAWGGASSVLTRWNFHLGLAEGWGLEKMARPALRSLLPADLPDTYGGYVDALAAGLLLPALSGARRAAVCTFLDKAPSDRLKSSDAALGWRLPYVVALLLDSPNHATR